MRKGKTIKSFCLTQIGILKCRKVYCCHVCFFFICSGLEQHSFSFDGFAYLDYDCFKSAILLTGDDESRLSRFNLIRNSYANETYHFCIKWTVLLNWPDPYNQLLINSLLLVPECYFAENVKVRVLKFYLHFFQNVVFIG